MQGNVKCREIIQGAVEAGDEVVCTSINSFNSGYVVRGDSAGGDGGGDGHVAPHVVECLLSCGGGYMS